jgi:hypothetical protein
MVTVPCAHSGAGSAGAPFRFAIVKAASVQEVHSAVRPTQVGALDHAWDLYLPGTTF